MRQFQEVCEQAARAGGEVLLDWRGKFNARKKGPNDLVTEADLASQEVIQKIVLGAFPDHHFIGEESNGDEGTSEPGIGDEAYCWVCDPLDGTTNYVHQLPSYCVSIALKQGQKLLAGVVFDPNSSECFSAVAGGGAFLNGEPIRVSQCSQLSEALVAVSLPPQVARDAVELDRFLDLLVGSRAIRRIGSAALNLCYLAAGRLDGYWATDTKIWDVAAGVLLVQEAGGNVSGSRGGPFSLCSPGLLATSTLPLNQMLTAVVSPVNDA